MKTRNGFVSNSSSSSFIVGWKGGQLGKIVDEAFQIPRPHPFANICWGEFFVGAVRGTFETLKDYLEWVETEGWSTPDEEIIILLNQGYIVALGGFSSEGGFEGVLCETDFDHTSEKLVVKQNGGY